MVVYYGILCVDVVVVLVNLMNWLEEFKYYIIDVGVVMVICSVDLVVNVIIVNVDLLEV